MREARGDLYKVIGVAVVLAVRTALLSGELSRVENAARVA